MNTGISFPLDKGPHAMRHVEGTTYFSFLGLGGEHIATLIMENFDFMPDKENGKGLARFWKKTAFTKQEIDEVFNLVKQEFKNIIIEKIISPYNKLGDYPYTDHV